MRGRRGRAKSFTLEYSVSEDQVGQARGESGQQVPCEEGEGRDASQYPLGDSTAQQGTQNS